ncbi:MAG: bacterial transcriptional activator domain-containing protein [Bacteroidales bacterium]|nr:bacterial transcriptional activator domain-containing protein [Bacteroidales bacterium]
MIKRAALFLLFLFCAASAGAKLQDGIVFRSYNVLSEERTSLNVPAGTNSWISFSDSLTLSFSVRFDLSIGHFGYVCRMLLDDNQPVDIVLSPKGNETVVFATANHHNAVCVFDHDHDLKQWREIYVRAFEDGGEIVLTANDREVLRMENTQKKHRLRVVFGKVDIPGFVTSDVAPMVVADLQIRRDSGKIASWMLSDQDDLKTSRGISIQAVNHIFARDLNRHWTGILSADVPSVTYSCFSKDFNKVYFISQGQILIFDIPSMTSRQIPYSAEINAGQVLDMYETLEDGTLVLADAQIGEFIRFNTAAGDWEKPGSRERTSVLLHHNSIYAGGKFFQMFGYGQHRYSNNVWIWDPSTYKTEARTLQGVDPRYLAGAAEHDGKIYVLGGKGNDSGQQELGVYLFDTFQEIDPNTLSVITKWSNPILKKYTPAQDLLFLEDGVYTLLFNPEIHESSLQLTRFDTESGKAEALSEAIPYPFLDIKSQARLCFNKESDSFISALCYQDNAGNHKVEIFLLSHPVVPANDDKSSSGLPAWLYILIGLLLAAALLPVIFRKRSRKPAVAEELPVEPPQPNIPGVYLLGGFHVRDREGKDIASSLSPTLTQFLALLVLYTIEKGGVSNAKLKSILWPDKSDESFNNNKGVYLKKLRDALEQVGPISILQEGGVWRIEDEADLCDCLIAKRALLGGDNAEILRVASWGALLPEYQFEWLDPFKARYTEAVLRRLSGIVDEGASPETCLRVANCRLLFDSLDEDAIALKCQALISLGRSGTASAVFQRFTSDYLRVMGEEFPKDFTTFVKN